MFKRFLQVPHHRSVFLWGPRKSGKSSWIQQTFPDAWTIDLLMSDVFREYAAQPDLLRQRCLARDLSAGELVVVDEVQKVPALLDEIHWLIENRGLRFLMTGSSARKLKRGQANLLGGRAARREMRPLTLGETGAWDRLPQILQSGMLAPHLLSPDPIDEVRSYVSDYLKEEIAAEAAVQNLPAFAEFLRVAALSSGELLNFENVAREVGVSAKVVRAYFTILDDTLLALRLPAWTRANNRRLTKTEKFYFFDVGVSNWLARRQPQPGTPEFGKSFEHLVLLELLAYKSYRSLDLELHYWRTASGFEVDFLLDGGRVAIEVKSSSRVHVTDLKGLTALSEEMTVGRRLMVSLASEATMLSDRFGEVLNLPLADFVQRLWAGNLI
jgi:uncharacterized protein